MNEWRPVVEEQLRLLAHVGLGEGVTVGLLGDAEAGRFVTAAAARCGVTATIAFRRPDLALAELPTLALLHAWSRRQAGTPGRTALYLHTKGVSRPGDRGRVAWRRVMHRLVVADWPQNLALLSPAAAPVDLAGFCWRESTAHPHFSGNVWLARAGYLARLDPPAAYRLTRPDDLTWGGERWRDRMFCETWVGSGRPPPRVASLGCGNENPAKGDLIYQFDTAIPGFQYDDGDDHAGPGTG